MCQRQKGEKKNVLSRLGFLVDGAALVSQGRCSLSQVFSDPGELLFITWNHCAPVQMGGKILQFQIGSRATAGQKVLKNP